MATTRSFENVFKLTDYTQDLMLIPNTWGLINELGIFSDESVSQHSVTVESTAGTLGLITDRVRGDRNNVNKDEQRTLRSFAIPHFPLDDAVKPEDVQGVRAYGSPDAAETEANVIARKLERIRRNHAVTLEFARAQALTQGTIYAPNGTVAGNYYTEFGVTRKEIDFVLGTATTNLLSKSEEGIAHIQDNILSGESVNNIIILCSPEFFSKLIDHASVKEAYKYYSSTQEPLRQRLGTGVYRRFIHGSVEYIEYRGSYNGQRLIPAGEAYMLPQGTSDTFKTYFSCANRFSFVNTLGEQAYVWTLRDPSDTEISIQSESNFLNLLRRPQCVVKLSTSN